MLRYSHIGVWLAIGLVVGCQSSTRTDPRHPDGKRTKGTLCVSLMTLTNPFFKVIGDTISEHGAEAGYDVVVLGADENAAKQTAQVKDFIVSGAAAIILAPYDSRAIGPVISEAAAAGIPVFTVDNGCLALNCEVVCHVATDNAMGGEQAAEAMIEALDGRGGEIAVLDHKVTESCILRVEGFKRVLDLHNAKAENKIIIVSELPSGGNRSTGHRATKDILQAHADLVGIFAINDPAALGAYAALKEDDKQDQVVIIGFDGQPEGKKAIRDGKIYADPIQFPDRMAAETVRMMLQYFDGQKIPAEVLIQTELYRQTDGRNDVSLGE